MKYERHDYSCYTKENLEQVCAESFSLAEVLRKMNRDICTREYNKLIEKIEEFNIDTSHFTGQGWNKGKTKETNTSLATQSYHSKKYSFEEIFCKNSPATQPVLKRYVKDYNVIPYRCQNCGCDGTWQGQSLALELHHIDGDNTNNEVSNLEYLCPNCHALTNSYRRCKTNNKPNKVSDSELLDALNTTCNVHQALIKVGLNPQGSNYRRINQLKENPEDKSKLEHKETHYCIDCGKPISRRSTRCQECAHKHQHQIVSTEELPITRDELKYKLHTMSLTQICEEYNITRFSLRRWCDKFDLPKTKREINSYSDKEWKEI